MQHFPAQHAVEHIVVAGGQAMCSRGRRTHSPVIVAVPRIAPSHDSHAPASDGGITSAIAASHGTDRFPREIKTVAPFNHPHILSLYDSGEVQGFLFGSVPQMRWFL